MTGDEDGVVHVWDVNTPRHITQWKGHTGPITKIVVSSNGRRPLTCSHDNTVILWNVDKGSQVRQFSMPARYDRAKVSRSCLTVMSWRPVGCAEDWCSGMPPAQILRQSHPPHARHNDLVVLPPDGRRVLTADLDGKVRIWTPREP